MSSSALQRHKHEVNMLSPDRIPLNSNKRRHKISNDDTKRYQMTSNDLK